MEVINSTYILLVYCLTKITRKDTSNIQPSLGLSGSQVYTEEEKKVLEHTSHINSNVFVPFMSVDLKDKFVFSIPFTDKACSVTYATLVAIKIELLL